MYFIENFNSFSIYTQEDFTRKKSHRQTFFHVYSGAEISQILHTKKDNNLNMIKNLKVRYKINKRRYTDWIQMM